MATITEARKALKILDEYLASMETDNGRLKDTAPKSKKKDYDRIGKDLLMKHLRKTG